MPAVQAQALGRWPGWPSQEFSATSPLLAFFADDPEGQPLHGSGIVHIGLALIAFVCVAVGTILVSVSLRSDPRWRPAGNLLLAISVAGAAAFLLLGSAAHHRHAPGGLYERIFLGLELLWIAVAAGWIAVRGPAAAGSARLVQGSSGDVS